MWAYCRGCNRDFKCTGEENDYYLEFKSELGWTHRHPKTDVDIEEDKPTGGRDE